MKKSLHFHFRSFLWGLFIIFLTVIPGTMIPEVPAFIDLFKPDKLVHLFVFGVFVFLMLNGFFKDPWMTRIRSLIVPLALNIGLLFSGITEIIQKFWVSGRVASVYDFIANVAGCLLGWWVYHFFKK